MKLASALRVLITPGWTKLSFALDPCCALANITSRLWSMLESSGHPVCRESELKHESDRDLASHRRDSQKLPCQLLHKVTFCF